MFLKAEGKFMTMTCDTPPGGIERKPKVPECLNDMQCEGKRSPLHNKCASGVCVMKYKRLVDVGMMTTQDVESNQCSNMKGSGWEEVKIEPTNDLGNNIKGGTSDSKIRLCARYSDEPVDDKDATTTGNQQGTNETNKRIEKAQEQGCIQRGRYFWRQVFPIN